MVNYFNKVKNYFSSVDKHRTIFSISVLVFILFFLAFFVVFKKTDKKLVSDYPYSQEQDILNKVSLKTDLPKNETPQVILVTDSQYIKNNQPFFAQAENGDVMVVYSSFLVLYRPSEDKIINSGPVINPPSKDSLTVEVRNGSGTTGRAKLWKDKLEKAGYKVIAATNAEKDSYEKTVVIFKPGINFPEIISFVKGNFITILPDGEKSINSDILVILGKDS